MIKTTLFSITVAAAMATAASATIVTMSGGLFGPFALESDGMTPVNGGLMRLGTIPDATGPLSSIAAIDAVFQEFGTANTQANGGMGETISNGDAGAFDGLQIYLYVYSTPGQDPTADFGLFSVQDKVTDDWIYPVHTGSGTDKVTIALGDMVDGGGLFLVPASSTDGENIILAPGIPEPSGALLASLAGMLLVFRRRR